VTGSPASAAGQTVRRLDGVLAGPDGPSVAGIDMRLAARHGVRTTLAWCTFTAKLIFVTTFSEISTWSLVACFALDLLACVLLLQGVYFGTKQVYEQLEKQ